VSIRIFWLLPISAIYITVVWFIRLYMRDRDKRKLLFSIVFVLASIDYIIEFLVIPYTSNLILLNIYLVASIPLQIAIFVAVIETMYSIKDFNKAFNILLLIFASLIVSSLLPFSLQNVLKPIRIVLAVETIGMSFFSFIKKKREDALLFGLSLVCFTSASIGLASNNQGLAVFSFTMAYVFLALVFRKAKGEEGISSYFALKKRLEETERKLRLSEEKYRVIVENTSDVIMLNNPRGIITYVSPSCERLFGYKAKEFLGKTPWELHIVHPDDLRRVALYHRRVKNGLEVKPMEYRIITKEGKIKWISHSISIVRDEKSRIVTFISSYRDVTERKEMEHQLSIKVMELERARKAYLNIMEDLKETVENLKRAREEIRKKNKELEELNRDLERKVKERTEEVERLLKAKEELLIQISHDIKTPLTPLCNLLPLVKEMSDQPKVKQLIDVCMRNVNYMRKLVTDTLQLLKADAVKLNMEDIPLLEEVKSLLENYRINLQEKKMDVRVLIEEDVVIKADRVRLREILDNLISNAIKYSKEGGEITIGAKREEDKVKIFVRDNGIGMTKEQLEHVFDEFYKGDTSRHDLTSVGMGLSICKRLVEKHGGKIWAESEGLEKGSTFYFTLPAGEQKSKEIVSNV